VIVAAGTLGTTALLLRSKLPEHQGGYGTLPKLSDAVGTKFTNNGDYLAFIDEIKEPINFFRGPNATSFIHVKPGNPAEFHTLEDAGLPNVFSTLFSREPGPRGGSAFIRRVVRNGLTPWVVVSAVLSAIWRDIGNAARRLLDPSHTDDTTFAASILAAQRVMGVAGIGRDSACGRLSLDDEGKVRLHRTDDKAFAEDPAIKGIRKTIAALAKTRTLDGKDYSPYHGEEPPTLGSLHPLGGCPIGASAAEGVADDLGQVHGYDRLYIADGSLIGQSLGVNPSLTISALALRIAKNIVNGLDPSSLRPTRKI
jgi:cholesterol oxidase